MGWIEEIQHGINYMEAHLLEDIKYEMVADEMHLSHFYFHKTFAMVTGITPNEYLRNRRLSLAGCELLQTNEKIIDIALKYGYDSPESFNRAFIRFHGIAPSVARKTRATLKLFNPLIIKVKIEGGMAMEYRVVERESFKLLVKAKAFRNEVATEKENHEIPDFWGQCHQDGTVDCLKKLKVDDNLYGVCAPISKESDSFKYGIGVMTKADVVVPEGYEEWRINPTLWAVFECKGINGDCISDMWDKIFEEFLTNSGYSMLDDVDFEVYPQTNGNGVFCEIWIPVRK